MNKVFVPVLDSLFVGIYNCTHLQLFTRYKVFTVLAHVDVYVVGACSEQVRQLGPQECDGPLARKQIKVPLVINRSISKNDP